MFCTSCGSPLPANAAFCGTCGQALGAIAAPAPAMQPPAPLTAQQPTAPAPQSTSDERIVGVIPNASKKAGFFKSETWNLLFTQRRMIAALITEQMVKAEASRATQEAQAQGAGVLKRLWSTATAGTTLYKRYLSMSPDQILAENRENFCVELAQIVSAKTSTGSIGVFDEQANRSYPDLLTIRTAGEKLEFQLGSGSNAREAARILRALLGDRVR